MSTVRYTQIYNTHFRPLDAPSFTAEFSSSQYDYIGDLGYMNYFSGDQMVTYTAPNSKVSRTMPFTQDEILLIMQSYFSYQYILKDGRAFYHHKYGGGFT